MARKELFEAYYNARENLELKAELENAAAMFKAEHGYLDTEVQQFIAPRTKAFEPLTWRIH